MIGRRAVRVVPGRPIRAASLNDAQALTERNGRLRASAPLHLYDLPTGPVLTIEQVRPFWATLAGEASPYDWEEARTLDGGGFDTPGFRSGQGNAYEVNDAPGLDGATVQLVPSAVGDYRFQVARLGGCTTCYQIINALTGLPLPHGTINGRSYAPPQTFVCFTRAASGNILVPPTISSPDNPLLGTPNEAFGIDFQLVSTTRTGGAGCAFLATDCPCGSLAPTLFMSSSAPGSNFGVLQSSALVYGPTPSWASILSIPPYAFISPGTFTDTLAPTSPFYYVFLCYLGTYGVLRIFETSPYGSPFRDVFRYQWVPGVVGNSCSPLLLTQGSIYPGGDPSEIVTISE